MKESNKEEWLMYYNELIKYFNEHDNNQVPFKYVTENNVKLWNWVRKQRDLYNGDHLSEERIYLLEKVGFKWDLIDEMCNIGFKHMQCFYDIYQSTNVPFSYISPDGYQLGLWFSQQKCALERDFLTTRMNHTLKKLNPKWSSDTNKWDEKYSRLEEYYTKFGDLDIPRYFEFADGFKLGSFVSSLRYDYSKYKLDKNRILFLNDLNFDWSVMYTATLNGKIISRNKARYYKVMKDRMMHILDDLSYELDDSITDLDKQKSLEKEMIKRMWR